MFIMCLAVDCAYFVAEFALRFGRLYVGFWWLCGVAGLLVCGWYELLFVACWFIAIISLLLTGGCCVCWVFCCVRLVLRLFAFVDLPFMVFVVLRGLHTSGDCFGV